MWTSLVEAPFDQLPCMQKERNAASDSPKRVFPASAEAEASAEYYAEASAEARSFGSRPKLRSRAEASVLSRSFGSKPKVPSLYLECPAD